MMTNAPYAKGLATAALLLVLSTPAAIAGPLKGLNGHTASGHAAIKNSQVELAEDFVFDGGPDVYVAVRNGDGLRLLGKLRDNTGAQSYSLPSGLSLDGNDEILLWCKQYNVTLAKGSAK